MIVYPTANYDSWISVADAQAYLSTRLHADEWEALSTDALKEVPLQMAFRSLNGLDLNIILDDDGLISSTAYTSTEQGKILTASKQAQCEQALHELKFDVDAQAVKSVSLGGMLSFTLNPGEEKPPRYSERALAILKPYLRARTLSRFR
jgi:hypothetical protein